MTINIRIAKCFFDDTMWLVYMVIYDFRNVWVCLSASSSRPILPRNIDFIFSSWKSKYKYTAVFNASNNLFAVFISIYTNKITVLVFPFHEYVWCFFSQKYYNILYLAVFTMYL